MEEKQSQVIRSQVSIKKGIQRYNINNKVPMPVHHKPALTDFLKYMLDFDSKIDSVSYDQLEILKKKYRFFLSKIQRLQEIKANLSDKLEGFPQIIEESQLIVESKNNIKFIEMVLEETNNKVTEISDRLSFAKETKKKHEVKLWDLKRQLKQQKDIFFNLKREELMISRQIQENQKNQEKQKATNKFKSILSSKFQGTRVHSRKQTNINSEFSKNYEAKPNVYGSGHRKQPSDQFSLKSNGGPSICEHIINRDSDPFTISKQMSPIKQQRKQTIIKTNKQGQSILMRKTKMITTGSQTKAQKIKKQLMKVLQEINIETQFATKQNKQNKKPKMSQTIGQSISWTNLKHETESESMNREYAIMKKEANQNIRALQEKLKKNKVRLPQISQPNQRKSLKLNMQTGKSSKSIKKQTSYNQKLSPTHKRIFVSDQITLEKFMQLTPKQILKRVVDKHSNDKLIQLIEKETYSAINLR